jgi:hypothetical protein
MGDGIEWIQLQKRSQGRTKKNEEDFSHMMIQHGGNLLNDNNNECSTLLVTWRETCISWKKDSNYDKGCCMLDL